MPILQYEYLHLYTVIEKNEQTRSNNGDDN